MGLKKHHILLPFIAFLLLCLCSKFINAEWFFIWLLLQVAAEYVLVLNSVRSILPFLVTTADDAKETVTEEIRLR